MGWMIKRLLTSLCIAALLASAPASAQILPPGSPILAPPPPAPPPPPSMAVPVVPQLDAMPSTPSAPASRRSFGDRITQCLDDGAASGLGPNDRAAYSRACANR
ncbi:MAG: hypothetical protein JWQ94_121 [Tardiphaga sp.]|nr:hypothetical protein [Tardiphaga sp.]